MAQKENLESTDDGIISTAAKKLGKAAGKVAAALVATAESSGTEASPVKQHSNKVPKLEKKNKNRLPRREKKARRKAGGI